MEGLVKEDSGTDIRREPRKLWYFGPKQKSNKSPIVSHPSWWNEDQGVRRDIFDLAPLGEWVTYIRRTRAGELLVELDRPGKMMTELQTAILASLNESAAVMLPTRELVQTKMDVDEAKMVQEVTNAISTDVGRSGICEF